MVGGDDEYDKDDDDDNVSFGVEKCQTSSVGLPAPSSRDTWL